MAYYYSASERAFFSTDLMTTGAMPSDKVLVDDSTYASLQAAQVAGKIIRTGAAGAPEAVSQSLKTLAGLELGVDIDVEDLTAATLKVEGASNLAGGAATTTLKATGAATLSGGTTTTTLKATGTSTLAAVTATTITASGAIKGASLTATGALVGGSLQITGNTATVGGKNVVRTVNDVAADATGNVVVQDVFIDGTDSAANRGQIGNARNVVNLDYNDYKKTGTWRVEGSLQKNSPADLQIAGILTVVADRTQNYVVQTFMRTHLGDTMYTRTFHGTDGWHPWRRVMLDVQDENCVHKTGVETIAGSKTFTDRLYLDGDVIRRIGGTSGRIALQNTNLVKGTNPTTTIWFDLPCVDGLDANTVNRAGAWSTCVLSDGRTQTYMRAYKWQSGSATSAEIYVGITQDGVPYTYAPTPVSSSNDDSIPTTRWVRANTVPPGTILPFAGTTVPTGFLLCNGALVSRTTYATLFAAIGTKWGAGDGKTTFKLPDLRKRHLEGANTTSEVGGYLEAGLPNITGSFISVWADNPVSGAFSRSSGSGHTKNGTDNDGQTIKFDASDVSGAYGASTTVQPASAKVLFIVKT